MAVYPLVTHHEAYLLAHRAYLLRAPPPGECQLDKLDDIGGDSRDLAALARRWVAC